MTWRHPTQKSIPWFVLGVGFSKCPCPQLDSQSWGIAKSHQSPPGPQDLPKLSGSLVTMWLSIALPLSDSADSTASSPGCVACQEAVPGTVPASDVDFLYREGCRRWGGRSIALPLALRADLVWGGEGGTETS